MIGMSQSYTPSLIGTNEGLTALTIRVDDLTSFRSPELAMQVGFILYRSYGGTWVVCLPFRVYDRQESQLEADVYLNPRQEADYRLLENLARQEVFPFVIQIRDLRDSVTTVIPWKHQDDAMTAVGVVDSSLSAKLTGSWDPEFEEAK